MATSQKLVPRVCAELEKEAKEYMESRELSVGDPIMVERRGRFEHGDVQLTTNVYGVLMKDVVVYRYDVTIFGSIPRTDGTVGRMEFTRRTVEDAHMMLLRERCRDVFNFLQQREAGGFFQRKRCTYYDLQSILFSLDFLDLGAEGIREFTIETTEFEDTLAAHFASIEKLSITIRTVMEGGEKIRLGDLTTVSKNLLLFDRSLLQFLDLATSQYAMFTPEEHVTFSSKLSYLMHPEKYFNDCSVLFEDTLSYLAYGAQKGARVIEGPKANGRTASLVVEVKKTAFHAEVNLLQKVKAMIRDTRRLTDSDHKKLTTALKGLTVEARHTKRYQRFQIRSLCSQGANSTLIMIAEKKITVEEYFREKYNIVLSEPTLPLVETRGRDRQTIYMPIEMCFVADNQRVNMNQQTPSMTQTTIRHCAVPPSRLREQIKTTAESLNLFKSEWLLNAFITVIERPLSVEARRVATPDLEFSGNQIARVDTRSYTWNGDRYLFGAKCKIWAAYAFIETHDRLEHAEWERFLVGFVDECKRRGLQIDAPADWQVRSAKDIYATIKMAAENNCEFVIAVHSDNGDAAHADIKYAERIYDVVTQCMRLKTVRDVMERNRRLTLSNIVNKTNMKLGGLNYTLGNSKVAVEMLGTETLFVGIGMNHPAGGLGMQGAEGGSDRPARAVPSMTSDAPPSVVGWAANIGQNNEVDMVGDFTFQAPLRDEKSNVIAEIVGRCLEYYQRGRKRNPKRVIVYRNGCSEGAFRMILQYEVPMLKHVLKELGCEATITIVVVNKLQNVRFFKKDINDRDKAPDQNVAPGVVVDHTVVHPMYAEFYLASHRALQGTARVPKYTIVYDDNNFTVEQMEEITFYLCFMHQIVYMPTSLPSPVYIANRYAERGRMLYQRWTEHDRRDNVTYTQLSDKLCYYNSKTLFARRINA